MYLLICHQEEAIYKNVYDLNALLRIKRWRAMRTYASGSNIFCSHQFIDGQQILRMLDSPSACITGYYNEQIQ